MPSRSFAISVVVVSDYEGGAKTWDDEQRILEALAEQDIREAFEVVLVEHTSARHSVPPDLPRLVPHLRILFADEVQSAALKDHGVTECATELVAVMEADCLPSPEWLRVLVGVLRSTPDVSVVSGRTSYGGESSYRRALTLLDRSFDDMGKPGLTPHISNNGAVYRRAVLQAFPYPDAVTPFLSSRLRTRRMADAGHRFYFEPSVWMRHAIGGFDFIRDFRRNTGFADMKPRERRGVRHIPRLLLNRLTTEFSHCVRLGGRYLRWYDWPLVIFFLGLARCLEIPGMLDALRGADRVRESSYR